MPGKFNSLDAEDGGWAFTTNPGAVGFSGTNNAPTKPVGGGAGGSGVFGLSLTSGGAGVLGANNSEARLGVGVQGNGPEAGVSGYSDLGNGVRGFTQSFNHAAVFGSNDYEFNFHTYGKPGFGPDIGAGVYGQTRTLSAAGVCGVNNSQIAGVGVYGRGFTAGVQGFSDHVGVYGMGTIAGLQSFSPSGNGIVAQSERGSGAVITSERGQGLTVFSFNDVAVFAEGAMFAGVFRGAVAVARGPDPVDTTLSGSDINGSLVVTEGHVFVNTGSVFVSRGDVILGNADCAEDFDVAGFDEVEAGSVMVLDSSGALTECSSEYDTCAVGVVSGAGDYKPAIVLDRRTGGENRAPLALMGKVFCKVDSTFGEIAIGDLLTTSSTRGHAMRAIDSTKRCGAVIGKALQSHRSGRGLIRILVSLQ